MASSLPAAPHSFVADEYVTSTNIDTYYLNLMWLLGNAAGPKPYCHAYQSSGQVLAGGGSSPGTLVVLDSEVKDTDGIHGVTGTFTINTPGLYNVIGQISMGSTSSGQDVIFINHNGNPVSRDTTNFISAAHRLNISVYIQCVATDTIQLAATSTSGNTFATGSGETYMQAIWVSE